MMSSLVSSLMRVGDGLQQAVRAYAHGAEADLKMRQSFALQPVHRHHGDRDSAKNHQDVNQRPEDVAGLPGRGILSR